MKNIPAQYLDRLDKNLYEQYSNLQSNKENVKKELENLYQYVAELNYDSKNNDAKYNQLQKQLHQLVIDVEDYTEVELDEKLATIASEQQIIRANNNEILENHQTKLKEIEKWEIKLENCNDEIKELQEKLKASIKK